MKDNEQEKFWKSEFGDQYIERNKSAKLLAANLHFFSRILACTNHIDTIFEIGCNVGMNLNALQLLLPQSKLSGVEINKAAADEAVKLTNVKSIINDSVSNITSKISYDLVFTKGVLIHINPNELSNVYAKMAKLSSKYVLIAEYFNPSPIGIDYRGNKNKLFKRDFADEFLSEHKNFTLLNYAFHYKKHNQFSQDNITWFLFKKDT